MKNIFKKILILIPMLAFSAGIIFLTCAFALPAKVKKGVTVNGLKVGGMARAEAAKLIREDTENYLKSHVLNIHAGEKIYSFRYPEINYRDNVFKILKEARAGESYTAETAYYLCGLNEITAAISQSESISVVEPFAKFNTFGEAFTYDVGRDGKTLDIERLEKDINSSLNSGFTPVYAAFKPVLRSLKPEDIRAQTALLGSFTTYFDRGNINRSSNISLAAARLNGTVIAAGKTLSFNDIVGARLKSRGFLPAKIIENGEFTEGVGGGVCQVSTTLYNAALLSGLKIEEYHPHSLAVSYVPPSRDAMVSGSACDLKIKNTASYPVYLRARAKDGALVIRLYGKSDGAGYSIESHVTGNVPAPEEETEDPLLARDGKDGTISESYLVIRRGETEERKLLRKDKYSPVKRIKLLPQPEETVQPPLSTPTAAPSS